jgi:hypothetical protein
VRTPNAGSSITGPSSWAATWPFEVRETSITKANTKQVALYRNGCLDISNSPLRLF